MHSNYDVAGESTGLSSGRISDVRVAFVNPYIVGFIITATEAVVVVVGHTTSYYIILVSRITFGEGSTGDERISGMCFRTAANRSQSSEIAIGTDTTRALASVLAYSVDACWSTTGAITIAIALGPALCIRTTDVSRWTFTDSSVVASHFAVGTFSALVACIDTFKVGTVLLVATLRVGFAFVTAAMDGVTLRQKLNQRT